MSQQADQPSEPTTVTRRPAAGGYVDAQGRPEIVMHPDVLQGSAAFRLEPTNAGEPASESSPAQRS